MFINKIMRLIIDSHCHLNRYTNIEIKEGWLPVTIGYSHPANIKNAEISKKYKIPYALGIAPQTAIKGGIAEIEVWIAEIKKHKPNAIGEIGLDFHWAKNTEDITKEMIVFEKMLECAEEMQLPVVIHSRKAETKIIEILRERKWNLGILLHFFSGTLEEAEQLVAMGALISIPTLHSDERKKIINKLDLINLVVETDSPYVARNFYDVERAIEYIAEIKKMDKKIIIEQTAKNAIGFFNIMI